MAAAQYEVGQSSRQREQFAHDVFLNFRGEDIRKSFIDHLLRALTQRGIRVFYDDKSLERGYEIQPKLYEGIERSKLAIVTFSRGYAYSRWCLDELVKIMERRRSHGLVVLTVFYDVVPTIVRKQSGPYQEAFYDHVAKYDAERVAKWRQALTAADLAGFVLQDGYEAQFIQNIVKEVETKLDRQLAIPKYMVGADSLLIEEINKWLQNGSSQVEVGIIYGSGGVGKTTIAKVVYNENYLRFESSSFLAGVTNAQGSEHDFIRLQKQLIRNITGNEEIKIDSVHDGKQKIKRAIGTKKILVVFDDINEEVELDKMFECSDWFFPGTKVLITSQNQNLLINDKSIARFQGRLLDEEKSVELFSYHAFGQAYPPQDFINISMLFIKYCDGLPLALEVLASSLKSKRFEMWESHYTKLQENLDKKVLEVLKWSFDSLSDNAVKDIFLHIAFFMVGRDKDYALKILDGCGLYGEIGLENLIGKCLVSVDKHSNTLMMHQLIRQMGREVVREEPPIDLGRRSRLLGPNDADEVLRKKTGTLAVKGLELVIPDPLDCDISSEESYAGHSAKRMRMTNISANPSQQVSLHFRAIKTNAFTEMKNLDLLLLENVQLDGGFKRFPKGIKWLLWRGCPLKEIPLNFDFNELVVLDMQKSCLVHAWSCSKDIRALKTLNLSHSYYLRSTPNLSSAHMLEWISFEDCTDLVEVHESMGKLEYLTYLNLRGCINLVTLPEFNGNFEKVITKFLVKGCINLRNLPTNRLGYVKGLDLDGCRSLFNICPSLTFDFFPSLKKLSLTNCGIAGDAVLEMISLAPLLKSLDLSNNPIGDISNTNRRPCLKLEVLKLENCGISRVEKMGMIRLAPSLESLNLSNNPILVIGTMPHSLKRITYFKGRRSIMDKLKNHLIEANDCEKQVEINYRISHAVIFERISEMNEDRASYLGFPNLNTFDSLRMDRGFFERGIYQAGVYIVLLRGNHMAECLPTMITCTRGYYVSSVSYRVPYFHPDNERSIRAVNVGFLSTEDFAILKLRNVSREWEWIYSIPYGKAANAEKRTWLTHWCVTEHRQIRLGDELEIDIYGHDPKYIGLQVIYKEEEEQIDGEGAETDDDSSYSNFWDLRGDEDQIDGEGAETDEDSDNLGGEESASSTDMNFLGVGDDKEDNCGATAGLENLHDDCVNDEDNNLNKDMNSSNMSTSQDEDDSATDVAVWYYNTFRSTDLSLFYDTKFRLGRYDYSRYLIKYPLDNSSKDSNSESNAADSDDESGMDGIN